MTKSELQKIANSHAIGMYTDAKRELAENGAISVTKLRSCNAKVYETNHYFLLKSYETFVAVINKKSLVIADVLRIVYGYTSTSAQHIAKFIHDYTPYPWNSNRFTAYPIN